MTETIAYRARLGWLLRFAVAAGFVWLGATGGAAFAVGSSARAFKLDVRMPEYQAVQRRLSPDQRPRLEAVVHQHNAAMDDLAAARDAIATWSRFTGDRLHAAEYALKATIARDRQAIDLHYQRQLRLQNEALFEHIEELLPAQVEEVVRLKRAWLRNRMLGPGRPLSFISGSNLDLIAVLRDIAPNLAEPDSPAAELLGQYASELHSALLQFDHVRTDIDRRAGSLQIQSGSRSEGDADAILEAVEQLAAAYVERLSIGWALRDLNIQFANRMAAVLPPDQADAFERRCLPRLYPFLYRDSGDNSAADVLERRLASAESDAEREELHALEFEFRMRVKQRLGAVRPVYRALYSQQSVSGYRLRNLMQDYLGIRDRTLDEDFRTALQAHQAMVNERKKTVDAYVGKLRAVGSPR